MTPDLQARPLPRSSALPDAPDHGAALGAILGRTRNLDAAEVERILAYQKQHGIRFGEAAVALGLADAADVARALSHQYQYPIAGNDARGFSHELVVVRQPFSPHAEVLRSIRAQLKMRLGGRNAPRRAVAVVSAQSGDGRSYLAANLALAFSQLGGRTLLIDGDLRRPRQQALFGLPDGPGLAALLGGRGDTRTIEPLAGLPSLFVLGAGAPPPNPLELLESPTCAALLDEVLQKFDHVVVDTPAFTAGMDAPVLAAACGAGLVVSRRHRTALAPTQDLMAALEGSGALMVGAVMNDVP